MNFFTKHTSTVDPYTSSIKFWVPTKKALLVVREISQYASGAGACDPRSNGVSSINIGDALIAVNDTFVFDCNPAESLSLFILQKLPFQASFLRYTANSANVPYINTRTCVTNPCINMPIAARLASKYALAFLPDLFLSGLSF